jgi:hypothetical protein
MRLILSLLLLATALAAQVPAAAFAPAQKSAAFEDLDAAVASLAQITGLAPLKKVQYYARGPEGIHRRAD